MQCRKMFLVRDTAEKFDGRELDQQMYMPRCVRKAFACCENAWPTSSAFVSMLSNAATEKTDPVKSMPMLAAHNHSCRIGFPW